MAQIKSEAAYRAAMKRIDELLKVVNDSTPADDPNYLELDMISDMVAEYEDVHYPISKPTLIDVIKLRLYEMGITQTKLAEMLGLSNARVSEIMNGKSEPSLKIGREISRKLNIDDFGTEPVNLYMEVGYGCQDVFAVGIRYAL